MLWHRALFFLGLGLLRHHSLVLAQRDQSSICDYYAAQRYGQNNATSQLLLMQGIVALAYAGGATVPKAPSDSRGIFNRGTYNNQEVYLRPWFDKSMAVTNANGLAVGIDWLDGGGTDPLLAFLNGSTRTAEIKKSTNQEKLFNHWYYVFGNIFKCSLYTQFLPENPTPLNPAYVHKYMNLNQPQVAYFINQLVIATRYFGFSDADATQLFNVMENTYNVRCLPPINGLLTSICLAKDCPLAAPSPLCDAYDNLQESGVAGAPGPTSSGSSSGSGSGSSSSSTPGAAAASSSLSGGAIAGIAVGGALAVILVALGACLLFRRQRKSTKGHADGRTNVAGQNMTAAAMPPWAAPHSPWGSHMSEAAYTGRDAQESSYYGSTLNGSPQTWTHPPEPKPIHELSTVGTEVKPGGGSSRASSTMSTYAQQTTTRPDYRPDIEHIQEMESPEPRFENRLSPDSDLVESRDERRRSG